MSKESEKFNRIFNREYSCVFARCDLLIKHKMAKDRWTDLEKGFIAGVLEGEGTISLNKRRRKNGTFSYGAVIHITNTQRKLLEYCQSVIGGGISTHKQYGYGRKDIHNLFIHNRENAVRILNEVIPLLIIKKEAAIAVRDFCISRLAVNPVYGYGGRVGFGYSSGEIALYDKVHAIYN